MFLLSLDSFAISFEKQRKVVSLLITIYLLLQKANLYLFKASKSSRKYTCSKI